MDILSHLLQGFQVALSPINLLYAFIGASVGTLIGVLPGLGPISGVALLIPITFGLEPSSAMILLAGIYYGAMYGGSTTSILLNVPGETASVVTTLDGYQMARQGRAGAALAVSAIGSFIAGTLSVFGLLLFAPLLARFAINFGPAEYFALMVFGLSTVTSLAGNNLVKALISMVFGLMLATIGQDVNGTIRYTFGQLKLADGADFLVVAIGLFAVSEVLISITGKDFGKAKIANIERLYLTGKEFLESFWSMIRGTLIGFFTGVLPGAGASIASFLSYSVEQRLAKDPKSFGQGNIKGVAAPESANNAAAGGAMIPLLTLGIPGSGTTAVLLGALIGLGITPGPQMFSKNPEVVWPLIASMYIGNVMLLILNLPLVGIFVQILKIPSKYLLPAVLAVSFIGVYAVNNSSFDLLLMALFGLIGFVLRRLEFPLAPIILGLVLGDIMEKNLVRLMTISGGDWKALFFDVRTGTFNLITFVLYLAALFSLFAPQLLGSLKRFRAAAVDTDAEL